MDQSRHQARHDAGTYQRFEVVTGRRRRQNWPGAEKARMVAESLEPGANISEVARRNGISRGVLTVWRRLAREALAVSEEPALFMPVKVQNGGAHPESGVVATKRKAPAASRTIEVTIADATMRVPTGADADTLETLIAALRQNR
ncbi:MAG: IS66-like element accessory protein TnpA [Roseiarcus sp.]|jgi:transposase